MRSKADSAFKGARKGSPNAGQARSEEEEGAQRPRKARLSVLRKLLVVGTIFSALIFFFIDAEWDYIRMGFLQAHNAKIQIKRVAPLDPSPHVLVAGKESWELRYQGRVVATMKAVFVRHETRYKVLSSKETTLTPGTELVFATKLLPTVSGQGLARCENCWKSSLPLLWTLS